MKTALTAILAVSMFGLPQQAAAGTLADVLFPKAKPNIAATSRPNLDKAPTGSVARVKDRVKASADKKPAYPEAFLWSFPFQ